MAQVHQSEYIFNLIEFHYGYSSNHFINVITMLTVKCIALGIAMKTQSSLSLNIIHRYFIPKLKKGRVKTSL